MKRIDKIIRIAVLAVIAILGAVLLAPYLPWSEKSPEELYFMAKVKINKQDNFQLFYQLEGQSFNEDYSVRLSLEPSGERFQTLRFRLPLDTLINKFRFDIGENAEMSNIVIEEVMLGNEIRTIPLQPFNDWFAPNTEIKVTEKEGVFNLAKNGDSYDPYFISGEVSGLIKELNKPVKSDMAYLYALIIMMILCIAIYQNLGSVRWSMGPEAIFTVIFCIILVAPKFDEYFDLVQETENIEKRTLTEKPEFEFTIEYARQYERYYDDNFGFRNQLIGWNSMLKIKLFNTSMNPMKVQFGKAGWLFYNEPQVYKSYTKTDLLDSTDLHSIHVNWEYRANQAKDRGAEVFFAFWPNKHSVYFDKMPFNMRIQVRDTISRMDQLISYMEAKSFLRLMDMRREMIDRKDEFPLYYKLDSHWNSLGAFFGYQSLLKFMGKTPRSLDDFEISWSKKGGGDLVFMLGQNSAEDWEETEPVLTPKDPAFSFERLPVDDWPAQTTVTRNPHAVDTSRVMIFGDSYLEGIIQFMSGHFREVAYIRVFNDPQYIDRFHPDIVIEAHVERVR